MARWELLPRVIYENAAIGRTSQGTGMVRVVGVLGDTSAARISLGIVRPAEDRSQAIAQNHQGPQGLRVLRTLALPPHEGISRRQYRRIVARSASIIARS